MPASVKAVGLIAMGLFLYSRYFGGTLLYYINERFVWLTVLAGVGFILVGLSYRYRPQGHQHHHLSWFGFGLVILPIILGILVPPKPLGAAAMGNRDVSVKAITSAAVPESTLLTKPAGEKNILDWLFEFSSAPDQSVFEGQEAEAIGFVFRDERFEENRFMVGRFVISCCAADASPLGLIVRWPDSGALADDTWVKVSGHFEMGWFDGEAMPILVADEVSPTEIPSQPYLYPY